MLGFGPPEDRRSRREWWRRQIERQHKSNLSVAEFCRRYGINQVTFYSWRRQFRDTLATAAPRSEHTATAKPNPRSDFVPVSIVDAHSAGQIEVELANACTVRVKGAVDPKLLRIAIRVAGESGGVNEGAH